MRALSAHRRRRTGFCARRTTTTSGALAAFATSTMQLADNRPRELCQCLLSRLFFPQTAAAAMQCLFCNTWHILLMKKLHGLIPLE
jgi:hypothetical protein